MERINHYQTELVEVLKPNEFAFYGQILLKILLLMLHLTQIL